jgi:hypothetical protein
MKEELIKRTLHMTAAEWLAIEELARLCNARPDVGPDAHKYSWSNLWRRVARGEYTLRPKAVYRNQTLIDRLDDAIAANEAEAQERKVYKQLSILDTQPA